MYVRYVLGVELIVLASEVEELHFEAKSWIESLIIIFEKINHSVQDSQHFYLFTLRSN